MMDIRNRLSELADEKYRSFTASLTPGKDKILGVRIPLLRKLAAEILKDDWRGFIEEAFANDDASMEETILLGLVICKCRLSPEEKLELVARFVPRIDCWPVCDTFCNSLKLADTHKELVWKFLQPYLQSEAEYEIRFGVVMLLHYLDAGYAPLAFSHFDRIKHEGYYARMAIAWVLSMYYLACPDLTLEYLKNNKLDTFTHNKAIQKIIESNRVDKTVKDMLKGMKRK